MPRHNGQFLRPHDLVFALTCTLTTVGPYIDRGVRGFQIMSNQLNLPQVDSNQVHGNRMNLILISRLIAKGLNTYVNKVFLFLLCHYGALCVD